MILNVGSIFFSVDNKLRPLNDFSSFSVIVETAPVKLSRDFLKIPVTTTSSSSFSAGFNTTISSEISLLPSITISLDSIPTIENCNVCFPAGIEKENFPSISVAAPIEVPFINTVTPGKAPPLSSETCPDTFTDFC